MIAEMQRVADQRKGEERERAERENRGDSEGGIFFIGIDGALRGDDGADAADRGAHRQERGQFGLEVKQAAEQGHERDRAGDFDGDEREADAAEFQHIAEQEARAEQHDADFEPEFVGGHAGAENGRNADGVGDGQAQQNGPQHVFDIGENPVMGFGVFADVLFEKFSGVADGGEQEDCRGSAARNCRLGSPALTCDSRLHLR